jgi:chromosome partitioning protein
MLTILVINSKGGSGKTTLTTNLASYYASKDYRTAIMDYDPQGSSLHWLRTRPANRDPIHGANAAPAKGGMAMHSKTSWIPVDTEVLIIDAPAGASGLLLKELVRRSNYILIPVAPSPIDIHATADFIKDLYLIGGAITAKAKIAVAANRVRNRGALCCIGEIPRFTEVALPRQHQRFRDISAGDRAGLGGVRDGRVDDLCGAA